MLENKKITVNTKSEVNNINIKPFEDKLNINNTVLNASLINLSGLIQKILEENKKNNQENDSNENNSSNGNLLNDISSQNNTKNKNIEVNKININMKKNSSNIIDASPNKSFNNKTFISNAPINTIPSIKGLMEKNNYQNYIGKGLEKSPWNSPHEEKNSKSNDQSEYIDDKHKIKHKSKKHNLNNKSLNGIDYRKKIINMTSKKTEATKNILSKKLKNEISLKKLKTIKIKNEKNSNNSKKNKSSKDYLENITTEESKIKDENKDSFINVNNKIYKMRANNNMTNNLYEINNNLRKSYQNLNINTNNNIIIRNRNRSKSSHKKGLTHYNTKPNLTIKNKHNSNKNLNLNADDLIKKLSKKEQSYYILSKSPVLRLTERILFGRSTAGLRNIQSVSEILKKNEKFLKNKIKKLEEKIIECDKQINSVFNASKTAEINFNFILTKDEDEFKSYIWFAENEKEKSEYYYYLKIIYILLNEEYENIEMKHLTEKLYTKINKKGYKTIKEYLYAIYLQRKENNNIVYNIDKINSLIEDSPIDKNFNIKFCRFALFASFLIREIIKYGNDIKNALELKVKTKEFIDAINNKLELYRTANYFKKK